MNKKIAPCLLGLIYCSILFSCGTTDSTQANNPEDKIRKPTPYHGGGNKANAVAGAPDQYLGSDIFSIDASQINFLTVPFTNGYYPVILNGYASGLTSFFIVPGTIADNRLTIGAVAPNNMAWFQDNSGLCPNNCDISDLCLNLDHAFGFTYANMNTQVKNTTVTSYVTGFTNHIGAGYKNAIKINVNIMQSLYNDAKSADDNLYTILLYVNAADQIIYQGFDEDGYICTGVYYDATPNEIWTVTLAN